MSSVNNKEPFVHDNRRELSSQNNVSFRKIERVGEYTTVTHEPTTSLSPSIPAVPTGRDSDVHLNSNDPVFSCGTRHNSAHGVTSVTSQLAPTCSPNTSSQVAVDQKGITNQEPIPPVDQHVSSGECNTDCRPTGGLSAAPRGSLSVGPSLQRGAQDDAMSRSNGHGPMAAVSGRQCSHVMSESRIPETSRDVYVGSASTILQRRRVVGSASKNSAADDRNEPSDPRHISDTYDSLAPPITTDATTSSDGSGLTYPSMPNFFSASPATTFMAREASASEAHRSAWHASARGATRATGSTPQQTATQALSASAFADTSLPSVLTMTSAVGPDAWHVANSHRLKGHVDPGVHTSARSPTLPAQRGCARKLSCTKSFSYQLSRNASTAASSEEIVDTLMRGLVLAGVAPAPKTNATPSRPTGLQGWYPRGLEQARGKPPIPATCSPQEPSVDAYSSLCSPLHEVVDQWRYHGRHSFPAIEGHGAADLSSEQSEESYRSFSPQGLLQSDLRHVARESMMNAWGEGMVSLFGARSAGGMQSGATWSNEQLPFSRSGRRSSAGLPFCGSSSRHTEATPPEFFLLPASGVMGSDFHSHSLRRWRASATPHMAVNAGPPPSASRIKRCSHGSASDRPSRLRYSTCDVFAGSFADDGVGHASGRMLGTLPATQASPMSAATPPSRRTSPSALAPSPSQEGNVATTQRDDASAAVPPTCTIPSSQLASQQRSAAEAFHMDTSCPTLGVGCVNMSSDMSYQLSPSSVLTRVQEMVGVATDALSSTSIPSSSQLMCLLYSTSPRSPQTAVEGLLDFKGPTNYTVLSPCCDLDEAVLSVPLAVPSSDAVALTQDLVAGGRAFSADEHRGAVSRLPPTDTPGQQAVPIISAVIHDANHDGSPTDFVDATAPGSAAGSITEVFDSPEQRSRALPQQEEHVPGGRLSRGVSTSDVVSFFSCTSETL